MRLGHQQLEMQILQINTKAIAEKFYLSAIILKKFTFMLKKYTLLFCLALLAYVTTFAQATLKSHLQVLN